MPNLEPVIAAGDKVTFRLVGLASMLWPGESSPPSQSGVAVLSKTFYARPLPASALPDSTDFVSGSYTTRLADAGETTLTFPNSTASDGPPWRQRFTPDGHNTWLEVYLNGEIEGVFVLDTVQVSDSAGYSSTLDASDFAASLWGNGAGLQSGTTGQLQSVVFDPATLMNSLFDVQGWQDFSDAAFPSLLQALLNSALGLRLTPWQHLSTAGGGGGGDVVVHGQDGMFLLKKAFERDWTVVQSPRDVIERATQLWVPTTVDNFPAGALNSQWTPSGTVTIGRSGGVRLGGTFAGSIESQQLAVSATGAWRATVTAQVPPIVSGSHAQCQLDVIESNGDDYTLRVLGTNRLATTPATIAFGVGAVSAGTTVPAAASYSLMLESDGEWVWAFCNDQLVGCLRRPHTSTTTLQTELTNNGGTVSTMLSVLTEAAQPFLMAGPDTGDYVLPGAASTFPNGGLHARYSNNLDLQSDANPLAKIHAPTRMLSYGGGAPAEYQNQPEATINGQQNPLPGASPSLNWWSCIWFGAIWLKLSAGDYTFQINIGATTAVRAWIGDLHWGAQVVEQWAFASGSFYSFTVHASHLAGTLPYGGGTVQRDGWYPLKIEAAIGGTAASAPIFALTNSPAAYTDPGGTAIASGAQSTIVPATSLSPLGCVDQRYQGIAHFDLAQQTIQAFGYQASVEPKQLESGLFPGVLAPRVREGHDTDVIVKPNVDVRSDDQGVLRPRQASTWPLPGTLAAMRWRPGDGLRVQDKEINVVDTAPRQILQFTRNLVAGGIADATAQLAERPKGIARALKQALFTVSRVQRNYQRQQVTLTSPYISGSIPFGATGGAANLAVLPSDTVIRVYLRVTYNSANVQFTVNAQGSLAALNGPWVGYPVVIDLSSLSTANDNWFVSLNNISATTASDIQYQLFADVMR